MSAPYAKCKGCGRQFSGPLDLDIHSRGCRFLCGICKERFTPSQMTQHVAVRHGGVVCTLCDQVFPAEGGWYENHSCKRTTYCEHCGEALDPDRDLELHQFVHRMRYWTCWCNAFFDSKIEHLRHCEAEHPDHTDSKIMTGLELLNC